MDLKAELINIQNLLKRNKADIIKHEQALDGLRNGNMYLQGQLGLIERLILAQEELFKKEAKDENVSPNLPAPTVPPAPATPLRAEPSSAPTPSDNSPSGNGS